ncbi:TspO/MBR family protein [Sphingomonas sp. SUN019]|uniref:TspO/MBR family protein n=1 Tax=Sphingomonas sp. SUN019 TaxID=2937788 RepID=UPI002868AF73|nr:TspO/MBR family protein [Sphingomonas sp. SUN019]
MIVAGRASLLPIAVAAGAAVMVAAVGATITDTGPWYHSLVQPRWAPPDALYAVAWTAIFSLTALASITAWRAMPTAREGDWLVGLFALNGFLNIMWSLLFFRLHRPDWAMIEAVFLWCSVLALIVYSFRRSMFAVALLVPYLCWVTFAGYLTMAIVRSNGPFG